METGGLQIRVVTRWSELAEYQAVWDGLADRGETSSVFQTYAWHAAWWESFGEGYELRVLLAFEQECLVGVAPFVCAVQIRAGRRERVWQWLGAPNYASDYCDWIVPAERDDVLCALLRWFSRHTIEWSYLLLGQMPSASRWSGMTQRFLRHHGFAADVVATVEAPTRLLGLNPKADRKVANKKSLRRHWNYFSRRGELYCSHCGTIEEIESHLPAFFQQHIERRALAGAESQFLDPAQQSFYRRMIHALHEEGWLRFSVVLFEGEPLAFHCGFVYGGRFFWYKPTFAVRWAKHSPGEVLLKFLLEDAIDARLEEFDFTVGDEPFKYRFANHTRQNQVLRVARHASTVWMEKSTHQLGRWKRTLLESAQRLREVFDGSRKGEEQ